MVRFVVFVLSLVLFVSCSSVRNSKDIVLVSNSRTDYQITLPSKPTKDEEQAARIIHDYIYKMSGAELPVVRGSDKHVKKEICIGRTGKHKYKSAAANTLSVQRNGDCLLFDCGNGRYTLYSVTDFVEKYLGVSKFADGCEVITPKRDIVLRDFEAYQYTPSFVKRETGYDKSAESEDMDAWLKADKVTDMYARSFFINTEGYFFNKGEYYQTHPEYFALGEDSMRIRNQICWTEQGVFQTVKSKLETSVMIQPDKDYWTVSSLGFGNVCRCDSCRALIKKYNSPLAPYLLFINRVAKEFKYHIISATVQDTDKCPDITFEPNVQIIVSHAKQDGRVDYKERESNIKSFSDKVRTTVYTADYNDLLVNFENLNTDIKHLKDNGVSWVYYNVLGSDIMQFIQLRIYLLSLLMTNDTVDVKGAIDGFCDAYYSSASGYMKEYLNMLGKDITLGNIQGSDLQTAFDIKYQDYFLTEEKINTYDSLFDTAEKSVAGDSLYMSRVQKERLALDYAVLEKAKRYKDGKYGCFENINGKLHVKQSVSERLERFIALCDKFGIRKIKSDGLTPAQYCDLTKRYLFTESTLNYAKGRKVYYDKQPLYVDANQKEGILTDGVKGGHDYRYAWQGWQEKEFSLTVDLDTLLRNKKISISSLNDADSRILHPLTVECLVSADNHNFISLGVIQGNGLRRNNGIIKDFVFQSGDIPFCYVRFMINGAELMPEWHATSYEPVRVFIDEITVE